MLAHPTGERLLALGLPAMARALGEPDLPGATGAYRPPLCRPRMEGCIGATAAANRFGPLPDPGRTDLAGATGVC